MVPINQCELKLMVEELKIQIERRVICGSLLIDKLNNFLVYDIDEKCYKNEELLL